MVKCISYTMAVCLYWNDDKIKSDIVTLNSTLQILAKAEGMFAHLAENMILMTLILRHCNQRQTVGFLWSFYVL